MEKESFEDQEIADLLNQNFISIKVDREERPDIDSIYMDVCQMLTGQGGWPLTVFLTLDQKPFFAGTYFPKHGQYRRPDLLSQLLNTYRTDPERIEQISVQLQDSLQPVKSVSGEPAEESIHKGFEQLKRGYDSIYGGFRQPPKFPIPHELMFLLRYYKYSGNEQALEMLKKTMAGMANGELYDHIGSSFARYSTDETWIVPHFEKMLYDNAMLLYVITECWQVTKKDRYKILAEELTAFIEREMTNEHGAFLSAIDADSEGVEGKYYIWSKEEVIDLLGEKEGELFCTVYNVTDTGNFEGKNIPNLIHSQKEKWAVHVGLSFKEINDVLNHCRNILFEARQKRIYPHVDDTVLTTWNGLMIVALAKAGAAFNRPEYINTLSVLKKQLTLLKQISGTKAFKQDGEMVK
jgi:uncharacterized protein YyaL (SSP411 family)